MNKSIQNTIDAATKTLLIVEELLSEHDYALGSKKMPDLVDELTAQLNLTEKQARLTDSMIRFHLSNHETLTLASGAKGGIVPKANKIDKAAKASEKKAIKEDLKKRLAEKVAEKMSS